MATAAGVTSDILKQPALTFDMIFMTVQAAIDGLGVAVGRTAFVEGDLAAGRLVAPFDVSLPIDVGFYLVCPEASADEPKSLRSASGCSPPPSATNSH